MAFKWAEQVEEEFDMICTYEEGATQDEVCFTRSGIHGTLHVTKDKFDLKAKLSNTQMINLHTATPSGCSDTTYEQTPLSHRINLIINTFKRGHQ